MSTIRKTQAEQFADLHHRDTRSYKQTVSLEKAAPQFNLNDQFGQQGFGMNLLSSAHSADRVAYNQFRRWTYVAISAIARRMMGYEFCAGDVKGAAPNAERSTKDVSKWRSAVTGEDFQRYQLSYGQIMMLPTHVRRLLGGTLKAPAGDLEVLDQHPVLDILNKPNHVQKKQEFIFNLVANLYLTGEAWIVGGESDGEMTLWAIPSTWVDVEHKDGLFSGFRLRADGAFTNFEVPEGGITRMYFPDPSDPKKVISPVQANLQAIQTDESLQKAHKTSFDQGIFPKIAIGVGPNIDHTGKQLKTKPVLDGDQREQLMSAVQSVWMSSAGDGLPAILDGLIDNVQVLQSTPVEMDYQNSSEMIKERIFQAFGLNPIIVGEITASNKAQALVAERSFCFTADTPIVTSKGTKPICDIVEGDRVLTHQGRFRAVTDTYKRSYSGPMVKMKTCGVNRAVSMTLLHTVYQPNGDFVPACELQKGDATVWPKIESATRNQRLFIQASDYLDVERYTEAIASHRDEAWLRSVVGAYSMQSIARHCSVHASTITNACRDFGIDSNRRGPLPNLPCRMQSGMVRMPQTINGIPDKIAFTGELAHAFGVYMAEGCVSSNAIHLTMNISERSVIERAGRALCDAFGLTYTVSTLNKTVKLITSPSKTMGCMMKAIFGTHAHTKIVPELLYPASRHHKIMFLQGYFKGDGSYQKKSGATAKTVSQSLAFGVKTLFASIGHGCSVFEYDQPTSTTVMGRKVSQQPKFYVMQIARITRTLLTGSAEKAAATRWQNHDSGAINKIQSVEEYEYSGDVFNFAVEEDESYVTPIGAVHNCRNVLQPVADTISTTLTDWLGPWFDSPKRLVVWLDKDEPADEDLVVKKWQHAVDSDIVTEDEYRVEMLGLEPLTDEEKSEDRSKMLDNPQAWANVHATIQCISTGKIEYEAGVAQVVAFFQVDEKTAKDMLGKKPTDEEIEENRNPIVPAGEGDEDGNAPPNAPEDDDDTNTPPPTGEDADPEDSDPSGEEADDEGKSKKKRLSAITKF